MTSFEFQSIFRKLQSTFISLLAGATMLSLIGSINAAPAQAEDLIVTYDQSQLLRTPRRVAEVIVGNPAIADVTVDSGQLLIITGKTFGITNIIALDAEKQIILSRRVVVARPQAKVVNLTRGNMRQSYNCTPECNTSLMVGDDPVYFGAVGKAAQTKNTVATGASGGGRPAGQ